MTNDQYTCDKCSGVFDKGWSDEEAEKERIENFGHLNPEDMATVCDPCYRKIMGLPALH